MDRPAGTRTVFILSRSPGDAGGAVIAPGVEPVHLDDARELVRALPGRSVVGFVLDVRLALAAPRAERGLLFHLAQAFPLLRLVASGGKVCYLDDPADFRAAVLGFAPREARGVPREPVLLPGLLEDGGAARPVRILDLSSRGGLVSGGAELAQGEWRLRIPGLSDSAPLAVEVRWTRPAGQDGRLVSAGLSFRDLPPGLARELAERFPGVF